MDGYKQLLDNANYQKLVINYVYFGKNIKHIFFPSCRYYWGCMFPAKVLQQVVQNHNYSDFRRNIPFWMQSCHEQSLVPSPKNRTNWSWYFYGGTASLSYLDSHISIDMTISSGSFSSRSFVKIRNQYIVHSHSQKTMMFFSQVQELQNWVTQKKNARFEHNVLLWYSNIMNVSDFKILPIIHFLLILVYFDT